MRYQIIDTPEQSEEFYRYDKKYLKIYPTTYPCIACEYSSCGGIGGDSYWYEFIYIPEGVDKDSFIKGFEVGVECESN